MCSFTVKDPMDFDLADAIDDSNDGQGGGMPNVNPGGGMWRTLASL